ncbi:crossover junction endonuclease EME1B-like isoform X1 [Quercus lobata]|uniref:crossover junction endonuclease EME1B-like isoform X1 n=1 Tax=Quercus lobata TaxID=97700 RepID=UPI0012491769|nr:crossover junction endonuclease EME1B-like isoform X1 [Quercus lobata]
MSQPILLSDEEDDLHHFHQNALSTPLHFASKKQRLSDPDPDPDPNPPDTVLIDDPTPQKPGQTSTPSFVPETPLSAPNSDLVIVKCTAANSSNPQPRVSDPDHNRFSGITGLICLESDNDSESGSGRENCKEDETIGADFRVSMDSEWSSKFMDSTSSLGNNSLTRMSSLEDDDDCQVHDYPDKENVSMEQINKVNQKRTKTDAEENNMTDKARGRKKMAKEERIRLMEEKKLKKEQEKLQKAAQKAEAAELKKMQKEKQKWEKGKLALKSIVAEIDAKVVELGSIGGHLLTRFAEKGLAYRITSNPIERSIVWTMNVPEHISQHSSNGVQIPYVLLVYEAKEFCNLVSNESLLDHVSSVQSCYPSFTICYLTNRLMAYINKREQEQYKNPSNDNGWRRPPVEEVLAKLVTHFVKVHSRQCIDEAELAEHVVGLTSSLASCQFRKKLTRLSVNANGSLIPKDSVDKNLIKKSLWLKALVSIPKVQPRFAIAIGKKYPTMKSLLSVYMDPSKSVHEKEFLLKDLTTEGLLGEDRRLGEICSKRVYRILMAQSGSIRTDDVEDGADFFRCQSS